MCSRSRALWAACSSMLRDFRWSARCSFSRAACSANRAVYSGSLEYIRFDTTARFYAYCSIRSIRRLEDAKAETLAWFARSDGPAMTAEPADKQAQPTTSAVVFLNAGQAATARTRR